MSSPLDQKHWDQRYKDKETGWDIGYVSTPIKEYIDQLENKSLQILIPGCGNAYEAEYLWQQGFKNVNLIDFSSTALDNFQQRVPDFPKEQLICGDFFEHQGQYDLILEQTFFCAIDPSLRKNYVKKIAELLKPGGKLAGLLFDEPLYEDHPPFGGSREEYEELFRPYFELNTLETAKNSIEPRSGRELFFSFTLNS